MSIDERNIKLKTASPDQIKVPIDWKDAKGMKPTDIETNAALAERNFNCNCDIGTTPIAVVEGYFIWWCKNHHQPLYKCELDKMKLESKADLENKLINKDYFK